MHLNEKSRLGMIKNSPQTTSVIPNSDNRKSITNNYKDVVRDSIMSMNRTMDIKNTLIAVKITMKEKDKARIHNKFKQGSPLYKGINLFK
jgi:hypothetical protein